MTYANPHVAVGTVRAGVDATLSVIGCGTIRSAQFIPAPAGTPAGWFFPFGVLSVELEQCSSALPVNLTVNYSEGFPADARLYLEENGV